MGEATPDVLWETAQVAYLFYLHPTLSHSV